MLKILKALALSLLLSSPLTAHELAELQRIISAQEHEIQRLQDAIEAVIKDDGSVYVQNKLVINAADSWQGLSDGLIGPKGVLGSKGQDGSDGANGRAGKNGTNGADGAQGIRGKTGPKGPTGLKGPDGDQGPMNCRYR